jgi:hypothetical protein
MKSLGTSCGMAYAGTPPRRTSLPTRPRPGAVDAGHAPASDGASDRTAATGNALSAEQKADRPCGGGRMTRV